MVVIGAWRGVDWSWSDLRFILKLCVKERKGREGRDEDR